MKFRKRLNESMESKLLKLLDNNTKRELAKIVRSKDDVIEKKEKFEICLDNFIYDNDLEDIGIYLEELDVDELILHFI